MQDTKLHLTLALDQAVKSFIISSLVTFKCKEQAKFAVSFWAYFCTCSLVLHKNESKPRDQMLVL